LLTVSVARHVNGLVGGFFFSKTYSVSKDIGFLLSFDSQNALAPRADAC
jgi:hypothetical protein